MAMSRAERIVHEFDSVRSEMNEQLDRVETEEFDWAPRPGMKSIKSQLDEVGRMEKVILEHVRTGDRPTWDDSLSWPSEELSDYRKVIEEVRSDLKSYVSGLSDADLDGSVALPEPWVKFWGLEEMAREEFFRWLIRHEYYHAGQITAFLWTLGKNPYDEES